VRSRRAVVATGHFSPPPYELSVSGGIKLSLKQAVVKQSTVIPTYSTIHLENRIHAWPRNRFRHFNRAEKDRVIFWHPFRNLTFRWDESQSAKS
jgi:hypothetical protein